MALSPTLNAEASLLCDEDVRASPWGDLLISQGNTPGSTVRASTLRRNPDNSWQWTWPEDDEDSLQHDLEREPQHNPSPNYISEQQAGVMNEELRAQLVDWMLQTRAELILQPLTVVHAVKMLDKFLSVYRMPDAPWGFQLAAITCLLLAVKLQEVQQTNIPGIQVCSNVLFANKCVQRFEIHVLFTLGCCINLVTPLHFLPYCIKRLVRPEEQARLDVMDSCACVILDTLSAVEFIGVRPSVMALAVLGNVLSRTYLGRTDWLQLFPNVCRDLRCTEEEVVYYAKALLAYCVSSPDQSCWWSTTTAKEEGFLEEGFLQCSETLGGSWVIDCDESNEYEGLVSPVPKRLREGLLDCDETKEYEALLSPGPKRPREDMDDEEPLAKRLQLDGEDEASDSCWETMARRRQLDEEECHTSDSCWETQSHVGTGFLHFG